MPRASCAGRARAGRAAEVVATTRREFCAGALGAGLAASLTTGCATPGGASAPAGESPFRHGVASGDPLADRVILWTRVSGAGAGPLRVAWQVARDPGLRDVAVRGSTATDAGRDYTVKVDALGLEPGTAYFYGFEALGVPSPVGRTRTLPTGPTDRVRLAAVSCSSWPHGFFNAYGGIARRGDLDLVLHLGDYLYEYRNGTYGDGAPIGRVPEPDREIATLADYRARHAQYRTDPDLQEAHRRHPFVAIWDDHESANNAWWGGAANHQPERGEGEWSVRRDAAIRAYFEWLPIRPFAGQPRRIYRSFRLGDLADLAVLDTRIIGRDRPLAASDLEAIRDPARSLLGGQQERWLLETLSRSRRDGRPWQLLGQQVIFAPLRTREGGILNPDQWDGFAESRRRVLDFVAAEGIGGLVVLTGDFHSSWALEVVPEAGADAEPRAVEFVVPAVSAPPPLFDTPERAEALRASLLAANPHVRYSDWSQRGYVLVDVDRERVRADWIFVDTVREPSQGERLARSFQTRAGSRRLEELTGAPP